MMLFSAIFGLWLAMAARTAASDSSSPARIEIDVAFPRNTTYNNMTTPPIVLVMQNAPTAAFFDYDLYYKVESTYFYLSGTFNTYNSMKMFNYTSGKNAIFLDSAPVGEKLSAGRYELSWDLRTSHCTDKGSETLIKSGSVASGKLYFTVVDDKSGDEYSISQCPSYLGSIAAKSANDSCPELIDDEREPQPCDGKLNDKQIKCIESYFTGNTDMKTCVSAFDDINSDDKLVWEYADEAQKKNDHAAGTNGQSSVDDDSDDGEDEIDNSQEATVDSDSIATAIGPCLTFVALTLVAVSLFI